ncbi:MAG: US12 family protein [Planctomycetes bacterium]|nr:US12 family protein [Planctomycetota bacterium]
MAPLAIESDRSERAAFIRRTYGHLAIAVLAFVALEAAIFGVLRPLTDGGFDRAMFTMFQGRFSWLIVMLAFMGVSYLARYWAFNGGSAALQYAGLSLYVVAEALIFVPILYVAMYLIPSAPDRQFDLVGQAGILTLCLFAGLTAVVFITGKDFSFIGPILSIAFFVALGVIICAILFGFSLGLWFSLAMIVLAAGSILYNTSGIMHEFRTDQHVAASLILFASVAMLFYYILLALMQSRRS